MGFTPLSKIWLKSKTNFAILSPIQYLELSTDKVGSQLAEIAVSAAVEVVLIHGDEVVGGLVLGSLAGGHQEDVTLLP